MPLTLFAVLRSNRLHWGPSRNRLARLGNSNRNDDRLGSAFVLTTWCRGQLSNLLAVNPSIRTAAARAAARIPLWAFRPARSRKAHNGFSSSRTVPVPSRTQLYRFEKSVLPASLEGSPAGPTSRRSPAARLGPPAGRNVQVCCCQFQNIPLIQVYCTQLCNSRVCSDSAPHLKFEILSIMQ